MKPKINFYTAYISLLHFNSNLKFLYYFLFSKPVGILRGHVTPIIHLLIVEEDNRLFSVSNDIMVKVWDIHDQACLLTVRPKSHLIKGELAGRFLLYHTNLLFRNIRNPCEHHHNLLKPKYEKKTIFIFSYLLQQFTTILYLVLWLLLPITSHCFV